MLKDKAENKIDAISTVIALVFHVFFKIKVVLMIFPPHKPFEMPQDTPALHRPYKEESAGRLGVSVG